VRDRGNLLRRVRALQRVAHQQSASRQRKRQAKDHNVCSHCSHFFLGDEQSNERASQPFQKKPALWRASYPSNIRDSTQTLYLLSACSVLAQYLLSACRGSTTGPQAARNRIGATTL